MVHFLFVIILLITGTVDAVTKKIHNISVILIAILAILRLMYAPASVPSCIAGCFVLSILMLLLALRRGGLGGGDIKLTAACGLFLGIDALLTGFLIAGLLALSSQLVLHLHECRQQKKDQLTKKIHPCPFPFGPYLSFGFILASFF